MSSRSPSTSATRTTCRRRAACCRPILPAIRPVARSASCAGSPIPISCSRSRRSPRCDFHPALIYTVAAHAARISSRSCRETAMTRPFEGIRVIDVTHVLAGPFAAYQLAVLGADVIKVEHPDEPDQSREGGTDRALNRRNMGTSFLTQGSNKKSITLDLKTEAGREILKKLVARADVLVENYRPGAFEALGLGYEALLKINPRLIYCSISAFGQDGVRREQTAYDHVIQATSGIMASTGTEEVNPIKIGAPAIDYATGTMGAFALAAALFQRERTGKGQHIDLAMLGVAMMLQGSP